MLQWLDKFGTKERHIQHWRWGQTGLLSDVLTLPTHVRYADEIIFIAMTGFLLFLLRIRKQLHWVVRSSTGPSMFHVDFFTVTHLRSKNFCPIFTYTIQSLNPSTWFSCTFACPLSTQPEFMRFLPKLVLFCSHASNPTASATVAASKATTALATSPNDVIPGATSSCPMDLAPWCGRIEVTLQQHWPHQLHQPPILVITIHAEIGFCSTNTAVQFRTNTVCGSQKTPEVSQRILTRN